MVKSFTHQCRGIDWYCETRGHGPQVVLIPSGEGDCSNFEDVAARLANDFTVLTFDTPGFSRSGVADPSDISLDRLGDQIADLVSSLELEAASFYGCSSGGVAALDLAVRHPEIVRNVVVHEVAIPSDENIFSSKLTGLAHLDDAGIVAQCSVIFESMMNEDAVAWRALGPDYHARLAKNYVTWVRRYVAEGDTSKRYSPGDLRGRPIDWTVGGLSMIAGFLENVVLATKADIKMGMLMCKHFPQVSIPEILADHIRAKTTQHMEAPA